MKRLALLVELTKLPNEDSRPHFDFFFFGNSRATEGGQVLVDWQQCSAANLYVCGGGALPSASAARYLHQLRDPSGQNSWRGSSSLEVT